MYGKVAMNLTVATFHRGSKKEMLQESLGADIQITKKLVNKTTKFQREMAL